MNLTDLITRERIWFGPPGTTQEAALSALTDLLVAEGSVRESYLEAVLAREEIFPTGLPTPIPVAIPHADPEHVLTPAIAVAILPEPVSFRVMGSLDPAERVDVRTIFLLALNEKEAQVKVLQALVELCQSEERVTALQRAGDADEALAVITG